MNSMIKLIQLLLVVKVASALFVHQDNLREDVVQRLDRTVFNLFGLKYPSRLTPVIISQLDSPQMKPVSVDFFKLANTTEAPVVNQTYATYSTVPVGNTTYFRLETSLKLVSLRVKNRTNLTYARLDRGLLFLGELIQHSLLKRMSPRIDSVCVQLNRSDAVNGSDKTTLEIDSFPIRLNVSVGTLERVEEDEFESAVFDLAVNKEQCVFVRNESSIKCFMAQPKTHMSLLRLGDFWIQFHERPTPAKAESQLQEEMESVIFKYNQSWVIGLSIIGGVIALFFLGCIVAICYTRRPYRRSGKVYKVESKSKSAKVPQIPPIHPTTKASSLTKNKELYY